ncbi:MAG: glycosyltransferase family 9 protein [Desulfobacterales bacterium]|jgi:ADP-heptose:LPS heptosyltransferase
MTVKKKLLIIHQGALGDFVLIFPAVIRLHRYFDEIDALCQSGLGKLAESLGIVSSWHPLESAPVATLFSDTIDPKIKAVLTSYKTIIVFTISKRLEQNIRHLASVSVCCIPPKPPVRVRQHLTEFVIEKLEDCGLITKMDSGGDKIFLHNRRIKAICTDQILIHPGAGSTLKRWPISDFLEVAAKLEVDGMKPEFVLGPAEEDLSEILANSDRIVHRFSDLLALAELLKSAAGYIGNDSGVSHLAAFIGLPTTAIFGPTDPERWAPLGRCVSIVGSELDCRPCFETAKDTCQDTKCLNQITPQQVIQAFYRNYGKSTHRKPNIRQNL